MNSETTLTSEGGSHADTQWRKFACQHTPEELLDALPAPIYATDCNGRVTYCNQAAAEFSGQRPTLGKDHSQLGWRLYWSDGAPLSPDEWPMTVALREGREINGPAVVVERPSGSRVTLIPHTSPLHNDAGQIVGSVNLLVESNERSDLQTQRHLLLDELNHRTKNNLQMLCALLESAGRETRSEEARAVLADARRRVGAMGAAQQVLYRAGNSIDFSAENLLQSVCANVSINFGKNVTIQREPAYADLPNHAAMPLALILNELLINAAKYGANERGEVIIKVGLVRYDRLCELYVEDEGAGFDFEQARKRSSGLGLVIALAQQINGVFAVERKQGARCIVRFQDREMEDRDTQNALTKAS